MIQCNGTLLSTGRARPMTVQQKTGFSGWTNVVILFFCYFLLYGIIFYGFSVMFPAMIKAMKWGTGRRLHRPNRAWPHGGFCRTAGGCHDQPLGVKNNAPGGGRIMHRRPCPAGHNYRPDLDMDPVLGACLRRRFYPRPAWSPSRPTSHSGSAGTAA